MDTNQKFGNLHEATIYFQDEECCRKHLEQLRWNGNIRCVHCNHEKVYRFSDGKRFKCAKCRKKFTVTTKSVFHNTNIPLSKWFLGAWIFINHKKGVSSHQLGRDLGVTQKTAWYILHRLREMLRETSNVQLEGEIECDETFIGGKEKFKHKHKRTPGTQGRSVITKKPVLAIIQRKEKIVVRTLEDTRKEDIQPVMLLTVKSGSTLYTDEWHGYRGLEKHYIHESVNHGTDEYVVGNAHTNNAEGFFSQLKRGLIGIYHKADAKHLHRYCDEFAYRYNTRKIKDKERFNEALKQCNGRVLRYKTLIAK